MDSSPAISIESLTKVFKRFNSKRYAVRDLTLHVSEGETIGLVGRNGAGKTTLLNCVLGILRPTSGRIQVFGASPNDPRSRSRVGTVSEENRLYSSYSVDQLFRLVGELRSIRLSSADKRVLLAEVGLEGIESRRVRELSKGMRQRLGIALANVGAPSLLILDEPMNGLDPVSRQMTLDLLQRLSREGRTIVLCSHLLDDVARVCSRVCVLREGDLALEIKADALAAGTDVWHTRVLAAMGP